MARVLNVTDRIKLTVEERGTVVCPSCKGTGKFGNAPRCPVCQGFKEIIGDKLLSTVVYTLAPLSWAHKQEILSLSRIVSGQVVEDNAKRTFLAMKYSLKGVEGFEYWDDKTEAMVPFAPKFDQAGNIEDASIDTILNSQMTGALVQFAQGLVGGIPRFVINPETGLQMAGVTITLPGDKKKA